MCQTCRRHHPELYTGKPETKPAPAKKAALKPITEKTSKKAAAFEWKCKNCGAIYEGPKPPNTCPSCCADAALCWY
jgi:rubrerythrin